MPFSSSAMWPRDKPLTLLPAPSVPFTFVVCSDDVPATFKIPCISAVALGETVNLSLVSYNFYVDEITPVGSSSTSIYVSKQIMAAHGGRIWAESAGEGSGSTFTFSLKIA